MPVFLKLRALTVWQLMKKKVYLFLTFAVLFSETRAQGDSLYISVSPVIIQAERADLFATGMKQITPDSLLKAEFRHSTLGEFLAAQSGIFIKNYSPGGISSPSFRGTGSGHTAVLWQGFNLQNPMHGIVDFSMIPLGLADQIRIQPGGASALFGSGAMGGIIHLSTLPRYNSGFGLSVSPEVGSFDQYGLSLRLSAGLPNLSSSVSFFRQVAENDFPYIKPGDIKSRFVHSAFTRTGMTISQSFRVNLRQQLHFHFWYFDSPRQLPPSALQHDQNLRSALIWERSGTRSFLRIRTGFFEDRIQYSDSVSSVFSESKSAVLTTEAEARFILSKKDIIQVGGNFSRQHAQSDGYGNGSFWETNSAFFGSYKHIFPQNMELVTSLRQGFHNRVPLPLIPAIGLEKSWPKGISGRIHLGRNYRLPTFNDLYWQPGGNPALLPESGFSSEAGMAYTRPVAQGTFRSDITVFHSRIKDWILWLPGGSFWHPDNVQLVWSRGLEAELSSRQRRRNWIYEGKIDYQWVKSTRQNKLSILDQGVNKQLIYVPEHNLQGLLFLSYKNLWFSFQHSFTGKRYTTSDNSSALPAYHLNRLSAGKSWYWKNTCLTTSFRINNLFNTSYEVVAGHPMPLRSFSLRLEIEPPSVGRPPYKGD
ncbi:MAG: TonB-dependent receptor plug domain-containing protein [Bacteroidia bacterium]|nr:TonB-dependent receptor plug domain-containing protein [Bacteroidia bacterium]